MSSPLPKSDSTTSLIGSTAQRQPQHPQHPRDTGNTPPAEGARGSSRNGGCARRGQKSQHEEDTARPKQPSPQPQSEKSVRRPDDASSPSEPKEKPRKGSSQSVNAKAASARAEPTGKHGNARAMTRDEDLRPLLRPAFGQVRMQRYLTSMHSTGKKKKKKEKSKC